MVGFKKYFRSISLLKSPNIKVHTVSTILIKWAYTLYFLVKVIVIFTIGFDYAHLR